ncbi:MAG: hypothetical protein JW940_08235 [Polyangiaceae bacterium]|nr:hypothetical protein [Polyangiaceae bacterium]
MAEFVSSVLPEMADNLEKWHEFSAPLEGRVYSMYCDVKGLVTCGVGNLIDPISLALKLPWRLHDHGTTPAPQNAPLASKQQVMAAWQDLKANQDFLKKRHWKLAAQRNNLRLSQADTDALVKQKLFDFEAHMEACHFPDWRNMPADAQLGICSMAWACGPGFPAIFKDFTRFANQQDWVNAALCAKIRETGNPGVVPRNQRNQLCFRNAAIVVANHMDRDVLHWPEEAKPSAQGEPPPNPTAEIERVELLPLEVPWAAIEDERAEHVAALSDFEDTARHVS